MVNCCGIRLRTVEHRMENSLEGSMLARFQADPEKTFPEVFEAYYAMVCDQVFKVIGSKRDVEDIAQEIFFELYQKRNQLKIKSSLPAYLRAMARTRTLNYIRDQKMKWKANEEELLLQADDAMLGDEQLQMAELDIFITKTIGSLPERCRMIFGLSRFERMSNREIAEQLDISIKTVENQMTTALKRIKSAMSHYRKME